MKKLINVSTMKKLTALGMEKYNLKSIDVSNSGGEEYYQRLNKIEADLKQKKVAVFCGKGNNGTMGFSLAAQMVKDEMDVTIYLPFKKTEISKSSKTILTKLSKTFKNVVQIKQYDEELLEGVDIVIDALFGTGFNSNPDGLFYELIKGMNTSKAKVVSLDLPSGIHGSTGNEEDISVLADVTMTIGFAKIGLFVNDGFEHSGQIEIIETEMTKSVEEEVIANWYAVELEDVKKVFPKRQLTVNKKDFGKVFNFSGSLATSGDAILSSMAALRTGTGLLKLGIPMNISADISAHYPEIMTIPLPYSQPGFSSLNAEREILKGYKWCDAVLAGPGLSVYPETKEVLKRLISKMDGKPAVLDGDALNIIQDSMDTLKDASKDLVITPKTGEFARLCNTSREHVMFDGVSLVSSKAKEWECYVIYKGFPTLIGLPNGDVHILSKKNTVVNTEGAESVFSGILVSLMGQEMETVDAIHLGTYIYSIASEMAIKECGMISVLASDIVNKIPEAIKFIQS